ncbi:hypothetical protein BH11PAT4_BH11PAT4_8750 [soil metagenome]
MIVEVVPILRLRRLTTWWSYRVPTSLSHTVQVGSLVSVPFRGRSTMGIVWQVTRETPPAKLEAVQAVHASQPLLLKPHRELIEWLGSTGAISLSTALSCWLPAALRVPLTKGTRELLGALEDAPRTAPGLANVRQQAAISPFQQPAAAASMLQRFPDAFWDTFAATTPKQELVEWLKVRTGKTQLVFGRERAIFAPYLNLRHAILAEAEDPSYYHGHLPYLPLQHAVTSLSQRSGADLVVRSNLPPATGELLWGKPVVSMVKDRQVTLVDLSKDPLINPSLITAIQGALRQNRRVLLLLNSYDKQVTGTDGMANLIPGVQTLKKQLATALGLAALPEDIVLGTRSILSETYRDVGLTVALNLDTQLNPQCFADELSLWSDLGSLFSYPAPCIVQARAQDSPVLHALRNQQFASYTYQVVTERITAGLPPAPNITFCSLPNSPSVSTEMSNLREKLLPLLAPTGWQVSESFERSFRKVTSSHLALIPPVNALQLPTSATKVLAELKRPWKVQVGAWHIL